MSYEKYNKGLNANQAHAIHIKKTLAVTKTSDSKKKRNNNNKEQKKQNIYFNPGISNDPPDFGTVNLLSSDVVVFAAKSL